MVDVVTAISSPHGVSPPSPWWREFDPPRKALYSPGIDVGESHWSYFEAEMIPFLSKLLLTAFPEDLAQVLRSRLAHRARFRPSEVLYALLVDLDCLTHPAVPWAHATVELLQLGRLVLDDVVDGHKFRWGMPTIADQFGDPRAVLAASALHNLSALCGAEVERTVRARRRTKAERDRRVDLAGQTVEHARLMSSGMQEELTWSGASISMQHYRELAEAKACNGSLCAVLAAEISGQLPEAAFGALHDALRESDIAAVVANDVTEAHGRRGMDEIRFSFGEVRGPRTEIQLGRPSIFDVYYVSDEYVRSARDATVLRVGDDLRQLDWREVFEVVRADGAVSYAIDQRDRLVGSALATLPPDLDHVRWWINSSAKLNLPTS